MLCDDWNHRSVEMPGSGSLLLRQLQTHGLAVLWQQLQWCCLAHAQFLMKTSLQLPLTLFSFYKTSGIIDMDELDLDYWLKSISERHTVVQLDIKAPTSSVIWNKQPTSGMVLRTVFCQWFLKRRKAKCYSFNVTEAPNPEMFGLSYEDG